MTIAMKIDRDNGQIVPELYHMSGILRCVSVKNATHFDFDALNRIIGRTDQFFFVFEKKLRPRLRMKQQRREPSLFPLSVNTAS